MKTKWIIAGVILILVIVGICAYRISEVEKIKALQPCEIRIADIDPTMSSGKVDGLYITFEVYNPNDMVGGLFFVRYTLEGNGVRQGYDKLGGVICAPPHDTGRVETYFRLTPSGAYNIREDLVSGGTVIWKIEGAATIGYLEGLVDTDVMRYLIPREEIPFELHYTSKFE